MGMAGQVARDCSGKDRSCLGYQKRRGCSRGPTCPFKHFCMGCGSEERSLCDAPDECKTKVRNHQLVQDYEILLETCGLA